MAYIGNTPSTNFASVTKDTFSGNASTTAFTLSKTATTNGVAVYVENVRQIPTTAYSVSGTTLTFTGAPPSGTNNIYVMHHNTPVSTATHPSAQDLTAANATVTGALTVTGASTFSGTVTGTALVHLNTTTASSDATIAFNSSLITDTYDDYIAIGRNIRPATDGANFSMFASIDNGSNFNLTIQHALNYHDLSTDASGRVTSFGQDNTSSEIAMGRGIGNDSGQGLMFQTHLNGMRNTTHYKHGYTNLVGTHSASPTNNYWWDSGWRIETTSAINHIKFSFSSGNIAEGKFSLYGIKS